MHMTNTNQPHTLTQAQIDANRENAKKSTGPRTAEGKAASSRNRLVHGLRANKHILIGDDRPEDFLILLKDLDATFRPVGEGEEMLVARIAADQWRLDRALPMEAGIFRQRLDAVAVEDFSRKKGLINHKRNHELHPDRYRPAPDPPDEGDRLARAFIEDCAQPSFLASLARYQAAIQSSIDRGLRQLKIYQAARIANAPGPSHQPSPPPDQPARPETGPQDDAQTAAPPAVTPQESANYHSNPTNESIAKFSVIAMLLALLTLLQAVPELIIACTAPLTARKMNIFRPLAPAAKLKQLHPEGSHAVRVC
jgi:hypothetical protein